MKNNENKQRSTVTSIESTSNGLMKIFLWL